MTEPTIITLLIALGAAAIGVFGTITVAIITYFLTRSSQREQWLRDQRKMEFKELLSALTYSFSIIGAWNIPMMVYGPKESRDRNEAEVSVLRVMRDRIFIAEVVKRLDLINRWTDAVKLFDATYVRDRFAKTYGILCDEIVKEATSDSEIGDPLYNILDRIRKNIDPF